MRDVVVSLQMCLSGFSIRVNTGPRMNWEVFLPFGFLSLYTISVIFFLKYWYILPVKSSRPGVFFGEGFKLPIKFLNRDWAIQVIYSFCFPFLPNILG